MPFPAKPEFVDDRGLFVVQEPDLRARILPLFKFDPRYPADRPVGHGTAFRVDPWGCCATAFHVIEDLVTANDAGSAVLRDNARLSALDIPVLPYGHMPLPTDPWKPFLGMKSITGVDRQPFSLPRVRNVTELAAIWLEHSPDIVDRFFPVDCRWNPCVGEQVMALGYAELDFDHHDEGDDRPISLTLFGSVGTVTEIVRSNPQSTRPWPLIRVAATWPGGMSGGPVFNESGNVVGLVSTGFLGDPTSSATFFSGWNAPEMTFPTIDALNPGRLRCWIGIDENDDVVAAARAPEALDRHPASGSIKKKMFVTLDPVRLEYMRA